MDKLVQKCLVSGCESVTDNAQINFFDFPSTDRDQIRAWNKALGFRANCKHIPDPKVCEQHFRDDEIDRNVVPIQLAQNAVPSIGIAAVMKTGTKDSISAATSGEPNYCRLCAKMERQPLKNSIDRMMRCTDTAKLLQICLESSRTNENLPGGVCDACSHMMKFLIKFVKSCCGAQNKLTKIFAEQDEKDIIEDLKSEAAVLEQPKIKKEFDDASHELASDFLEIEIEKEELNNEATYIATEDIEQVESEKLGAEKSSDVDLNVKTEPNTGESDSDFELPNDFQDSSASDSESGSGSDNDEYDEPMNIELNKTNPTVKSEDDTMIKEEKPQKRRGRPRKHEPRLPKGERKPRGKRGKKCNEDKPASLCKQICQICGKILSSSATFNVHMMTHTQQKDIACPMCDRRFYVKQQLKIHIESIHEKKDFVCSICGLKCRWRKSLRRHMLLHDANPYKHKCTYCDKAFARPNQLRYHVMKHTGDRVYCEICGADYRFNYMLTQHKIRKHGIVVEGVQLYKQSARKKKSEGGEQNPRRNRFPLGQPMEDQIQQPLVLQPTALPHITLPEHDRTNQSDLTHVSDMGSPATTASFATIASPEPPHFTNHPHPHVALQQHHQVSPIGGFNGTGLSMSMPPGLIGFPPMNRQ